MTPAEHLSALRKIRAACAHLQEVIRETVSHPSMLLNEVDTISARVEYYADEKLLASQSAQLNDAEEHF